jgi:hypothetical protein
MLLIFSLFLICAIVTPSIGERLRRRHRDDQRRKRLEAFLRDTPVAHYSFD